jgi:hypothetical protein
MSATTAVGQSSTPLPGDEVWVHTAPSEVHLFTIVFCNLMTTDTMHIGKFGDTWKISVGNLESWHGGFEFASFPRDFSAVNTSNRVRTATISWNYRNIDALAREAGWHVIEGVRDTNSRMRKHPFYRGYVLIPIVGAQADVVISRAATPAVASRWQLPSSSSAAAGLQTVIADERW